MMSKQLLSWNGVRLAIFAILGPADGFGASEGENRKNRKPDPYHNARLSTARLSLAAGTKEARAGKPKALRTSGGMA
jgi:hypothetical protein